ncbi:hypothetical protein BPTFM16_01898 [Altererythrobacter insulae]|nr:hypothetical protein BPTFM16_01898 [Altererythrobacter insulae]
MRNKAYIVISQITEIRDIVIWLRFAPQSTSRQCVGFASTLNRRRGRKMPAAWRNSSSSIDAPLKRDNPIHDLLH